MIEGDLGLRSSWFTLEGGSRLKFGSRLEFGSRFRFNSEVRFWACVVSVEGSRHGS